MKDLDSILSRIHSGKKLEAKDLKVVSEALKEVKFQEVGRKLSADDVYLLLSALSAAKPDRELFERFFDFEDPTTASLVARVLCSSPEGRSEYLERLISLALGSSWDPDGDVQQDAIELLGRFLADELRGGARAARVSRVLQLLFELLEEDNEQNPTQLWSYTALLLAGKVSEEELPSRYATLEFCRDNPRIRWDVLDKLRLQLSSSISD